MLNNLPTIADAADEFGVTPKTVRSWIKKGIIDYPPSIVIGTREVLIFPENYMRDAVLKLREHVEAKRKNGDAVKRAAQ